jgi:transcriptional regulator with XRE-family HTH domain
MNNLALSENDLRRRLGSNVRALRTSTRLTLKKAAARGDMHWRHWQKIEAAQTNATLFTLLRLADVLNVEPGDLLREPEAPASSASDAAKEAPAAPAPEPSPAHH